MLEILQRIGDMSNPDYVVTGQSWFILPDSPFQWDIWWAGGHRDPFFHPSHPTPLQHIYHKHIFRSKSLSETNTYILECFSISTYNMDFFFFFGFLTLLLRYYLQQNPVEFKTFSGQNGSEQGKKTQIEFQVQTHTWNPILTSETVLSELFCEN